MQAKADYRVNPPNTAQVMAPPAVDTLPVPLVHQDLLADEEAKVEYLKLTGVVLHQKKDPTKPPTIEYSSKQIESVKCSSNTVESTWLDIGCEKCAHTPPTQLVLPSQLLADLQGKDLLGVPVTQPMVDLCPIFDCTDDLKGSTISQVVRMWPAHYKQF